MHNTSHCECYSDELEQEMLRKQGPSLKKYFLKLKANNVSKNCTVLDPIEQQKLFTFKFWQYHKYSVCARLSREIERI